MPAKESFVEIDTQGSFEQYLDLAARSARYAIDTEFHRERTYYPDLALIQMRFLDETGAPRGALIDPKALDLSPLVGLFTSNSLALMHAPTQDFDVFEHEVNCLPSRFFDTQTAAGFLGFSSASLSTLSHRFAKVAISKADRLSDWNRRPLSASQKAYAYSDVAYLESIADALVRELRRQFLPQRKDAGVERVSERLRRQDAFGRFADEARRVFARLTQAQVDGVFRRHFEQLTQTALLQRRIVREIGRAHPLKVRAIPAR